MSVIVGVLAAAAVAGPQFSSLSAAAAAPSGGAAAAGHSSAGALRVAPPRTRSQPARARIPLPRAAAPGAGTWTAIGPTPAQNLDGPGTPESNSGGRVTSLALDPTNTSGQVVYAGTASGGVWKSVDGGANWTPLTDHQASLAIGSIAVDATGQVIYAGTGEGNISGDQQPGQGILKSTDGGATWTLLGTAQFAGAHIGGLAIDSTTSGATERILAATDLGLYISNDAGSTWTLDSQPAGLLTGVGGATPSGALFEIYQDPAVAGKFWASAGDGCNTEQGAILTSMDGGTTWAMSDAFPGATSRGRIALGIGPGGVAYAAAGDCEANSKSNLIELDKTSTGGASWNAIPLGTTPGLVNYLGGQGTYDNVVRVDPTNPNNAIFGGSLSSLATTNGGTSFTDVVRWGQNPTSGVHPDAHAVAFTGAGSFYYGSDGGVWKTTDMGGTGAVSDWANENATFDTIQFYEGRALDTAHMLGGTQDNGSLGVFPGGATPPAWLEQGGGDGGYVAIDPTPGSTTIYYETPGQIERANSNDPLGTETAASPCDPTISPKPTTGPCAETTAFLAPFAMDPTNPQHLVAATTKVYATTNGGVPAGLSSWHAVSGDLTFGGTDDIGRVEVYGNTIMTSSEQGKVELSTDNGATWAVINGNLPAPGAGNTFLQDNWVSGFTFNPANPAEAWVVLSGVNVGHVFHTTNAGPATTWTDLSGTGSTGVPSTLPVTSLSPYTAGQPLFIGTLNGVLACATCAGAGANGSWTSPGSGLPAVKVAAVNVSADGSTLIAWTHGRGAWSMPLSAAPPPTPSVFHSLAPVRVLDTRSSAGSCSNGCATLTGGSPVTVQVTHDITGASSGVPGDGSATAVVLNVTVTNPTASGYLTLWAADGSARPTASNLNFTPGQTVPNLAVVPLSANGSVALFANAGSVDVILDVAGFDTTGGGPAGLYRPLVPARLMDTRGGPANCGGACTTFGGNTVQTLQVTGNGDVPADGSVDAVVLNVTVTNPTTSGYLTVYPHGGSRPTASNLNFVPGQTVPNRVIVKLGGGPPPTSVDIYNLAGSTDVVVDVNGYFTSASASGSNGAYSPLAPARIMDTRGGYADCTTGACATLGPGGSDVLHVSGNGGVPGGASAVVLNVTVTNPTDGSYITVYPSDVSKPTASDLNDVPGLTVPNLVVVKLAADGTVTIYNNSGSVDVIVDVEGWFS